MRDAHALLAMISHDHQLMDDAVCAEFTDYSWVPDEFAFTFEFGDETTLNCGTGGEAMVSAEGSQRKFPCPAPISAKLG